MKVLTWATTGILLALAGGAQAALIERLNGLAYYDDVSDLTWLANANTTDTRMTWTRANNWASSLQVGNITEWRLPTTMQPDASCDIQLGNTSYGKNCTGSELGNLFYSVLGNTAGAFTNAGPFNNVEPLTYWTSTEYAPDINSAWGLSMYNGNQYYYTKGSFAFAWAVADGDVAVVPVPAAIWLFGSGLLGLATLARRKS